MYYVLSGKFLSRHERDKNTVLKEKQKRKEKGKNPNASIPKGEKRWERGIKQDAVSIHRHEN